MTIGVGDLIGWITALVLVAIAWGDLKRTVQKNRELGLLERQADRDLGSARHEQNTEKLDVLIEDVKRINGTVARHDTAIQLLRGRRAVDREEGGT